VLTRYGLVIRLGGGEEEKEGAGIYKGENVSLSSP
jgi:hypothetical protein